MQLQRTPCRIWKRIEAEPAAALSNQSTLAQQNIHLRLLLLDLEDTPYNIFKKERKTQKQLGRKVMTQTEVESFLKLEHL